MAGRKLVHQLLGEAAREIRRDVRDGATWADAHLVSVNGGAKAIVDSSIGFDEERHPGRGGSPRPPTTIFVTRAA